MSRGCLLRRPSRGRGCGRRRRSRGLVHDRGRRNRSPDREQRLRVDVPVRVGRQADAQVDVGLRAFRIAAGADRADDVALRDRRPHAKSNRPQVDERDGVAVFGANG